MNETRPAWLACAAAAAVAMLFATSLPSADNPPPVARPDAPPGAALDLQERSRALTAALQRQMAAERFVNLFHVFPPGVDLIKELKLSDDQSAKLEAIVGRSRQESTAARQQMPLAIQPGEVPQDATTRLRGHAEAMAVIHERAKNEISAVLTPEQIVRAEQISLQTKMRISGLARGLGREAADALGITPEQADKLQEAEAAAQEAYQKEFAALRDQQRQRLAEAREKVLGVLTAEQQAKLAELIGTPIEADDRTLDYGVAGASSRMTRDRALSRPGFGFAARAPGAPVAPPNPQPARPAAEAAPAEPKP